LKHKRTIQALALSLVGLLIIALFFQLHLVRDSAEDGVLLWNSQEAYLFVGWGRSGYHLSCFEYLLAYVPAYFGVPRTVDDNRLSMIVVRITPTSIEQHVAEPYKMYRGFLAYVPRGNTIYAYDGSATLWKWTGTHFETATLDEQRELALDEKTLASKTDYTNVNGWSARHSFTARPAKSEIELQGKPLIFFTKVKDSGSEVSLDLQLPGRAPQMMLWTRNAWHLVSKSEYDRIFKQP
jgi:hypothetical protein